MIADYLTAGAYKVTKAAVSLFDGTLTASPTIGSWPSGVTGRCNVTISSLTGHTDCAGTLTIGSETLTFTQASTKITTVNLIAKPAVSSSGLDCHCHITVIDVGGADVIVETTTAINTRIEPYQSGFYNPSGVWTKTDNVVYSDTSMNLGDLIRDGSNDYTIKKVNAYKDLGGTVQFYTYLA